MSDQMPTKLDMYNASVPPILRALKNLQAILVKAKTYCEGKKISDETLLGARLALDMLPFKTQITIMSDNAKGAVARLGLVDIPKFEDTETTIDQLIERLQKTADFVASVPAAGFEGSEKRDIVLTFGTQSFPFVGYSYLTGFVLPNINFHMTIAYAILRMNGVPLGKGDYLGG